jgi:hypothetical protein
MGQLGRYEIALPRWGPEVTSLAVDDVDSK